MRLKSSLQQGVPLAPIAFCSPSTIIEQKGYIQHTYAIVDTGAQSTFLAPRLVQKLGLPKIGERTMRGATGVGIGGLFAAVAILEFEHEGMKLERYFEVQVVSGPMLEEVPLDACLGRDVLVQLAAINLDFTSGVFELIGTADCGLAMPS